MNQKGNILILILVGALFLTGVVGGIYYLGRERVSSDSHASTYVQATTTSSFNYVPSPSPTPTSEWKTYKTDNYSIGYPASWYTYIYPDHSKCVILSDVSNPQDIPSQISPTGHTLIQVCDSNLAMPESFPYTNGSSKNTTITPFNISGYTGIRGKQSSTLGEVDTVYLNNPGWGHIEIQLQTGDESIFEKLLASFRFKTSN